MPHPLDVLVSRKAERNTSFCKSGLLSLQTGPGSKFDMYIVVKHRRRELAVVWAILRKVWRALGPHFSAFQQNFLANLDKKLASCSAALTRSGRDSEDGLSLKKPGISGFLFEYFVFVAKHKTRGLCLFPAFPRACSGL